MSILIFYYYSDLAIIGLFCSETRRDTVQDYFVGKRVWPPSEIYFEPYVKHRTSHEPNFTRPIKFMRSTAFDPIKFDWFYLDRLRRFFTAV